MIRRTSFDAFNDEFERNLSSETKISEAFRIAEENFEKEHGFKPYSNYESFRVTRNRKIKRKRPD